MIIIAKKTPSSKKKSLAKDVKKADKKPTGDGKAEKPNEINVLKHVLVPHHSKLGETEKAKLLEKYKISLKELPRISRNDPAISHMDVTTDDVIKIIRPSKTSKTSVYYRRVV